MTTPQTAAGRALLARRNWTMTNDPGDARPSDAVAYSEDLDDILAIEAEASAAALDEAYEAMKRLPHGRAYALAAIDALRRDEG